MSNLTTNEVAQECDHKWKIVHDWIGDQNVINGTQHFSYLECTACGETDEDTSKHEPDYYEPERTDFGEAAMLDPEKWNE